MSIGQMMDLYPVIPSGNGHDLCLCNVRLHEQHVPFSHTGLDKLGPMEKILF